jgi:hypothetical protein
VSVSLDTCPDNYFPTDVMKKERLRLNFETTPEKADEKAEK